MQLGSAVTLNRRPGGRAWNRATAGPRIRTVRTSRQVAHPFSAPNRRSQKNFFCIKLTESYLPGVRQYVPWNESDIARPSATEGNCTKKKKAEETCTQDHSRYFLRQKCVHCLHCNRVMTSRHAYWNQIGESTPGQRQGQVP